MPNDLSDEQAASFFVNPATAAGDDAARFEGEPRRMAAAKRAGGELGKMVIRLGYKCAFRTINIVRRREQVEELKKLARPRSS